MEEITICITIKLSIYQTFIIITPLSFLQCWILPCAPLLWLSRSKDMSSLGMAAVPRGTLGQALKSKVLKDGELRCH